MFAANMWHLISTAPDDRDLRLAVIDRTGEHVLVFPCRHETGRWVNSTTGMPVAVRPTHWQDWNEADRAETVPPMALRH